MPVVRDVKSGAKTNIIRQIDEDMLKIPPLRYP